MVIEKNVKYLYNQVKMTGFGETHEAAIREQMGKGMDSFVIVVKKEFGDEDNRDMTESSLHFNKGKEDIYHFNTYDMRITNRPEDPVASMLETVRVDGKHPGNTYSLKEMYNFKLGGSVEKKISYSALNKETGEIESRSFTTWKKADHTNLNNYNTYAKKNYNWKNMERDLLASSAIKLLKDPDLTAGLVRSMKKGNVQKITLQDGETEIIRWIAVDAEYKRIGIYDNNPRAYRPELLKQLKEQEEQKIDTGQSLSEQGNQAIPAGKDDQVQETKVVPLYPKNVPLKDDAGEERTPSKVAETKKQLGDNTSEKTNNHQGENTKTTRSRKKKVSHKI